MLRRLLFAFLMSSALGFAQLVPNSITVTATRTINLSPDQVNFSVTVAAPLTTTLDQIVAAVAGAGVTAQNLSSVGPASILVFTGNVSMPAPMLDWMFTSQVPLAQLKTTIAMLTNLQNTIAQNNSGLSLSFSVSGLQVSQQLQQAQTCSLSGLISDAQTEAQQIASAGGLGLNGISALSSVTNSTTGSGINVYLPTTFTCSLTVRFGAVRLSQ